MNIKQIREITAKLISGCDDYIGQIEDKENQSDNDTDRIDALEEFKGALEDALDNIETMWK